MGSSSFGAIFDFEPVRPDDNANEMDVKQGPSLLDGGDSRGRRRRRRAFIAQAAERFDRSGDPGASLGSSHAPLLNLCAQRVDDGGLEPIRRQAMS